MSLWQIAARNVWQNRGRYVAYLASSAFSVMIYFLYSALIYHPQMQGGYFAAGYVVQGMKAAAVVIAIFTFLFLLYANSAFVRSRMKEFGLLSLLGVSKGHLTQIICFEGLFIGAAALVAGLGFGLLFLKLFFMAISAVLQLDAEISLYISGRVFSQTLMVFGGMYLVVTLASLRGVLKRNIVELVRAGRQPKAAPTFSGWKALLGLLLVGGGYAWAAYPSVMVVFIGIIPVTTIVCIGTYLLMREGSIALLTWLHRRDRIFYRPGPFLSVSQLVYKMQDNYRVLSAVALLVAVILTAVGTAYTAYALVTEDALASHPNPIQLARTGEGDLTADAQRVERALEAQGLTGLARHDLVTFTGLLLENDVAPTLVPYSFYAAVVSKPREPLAAGEALLIRPNAIAHLPESGPIPDTLVVGAQQQPVTLYATAEGRALNLAGPWVYLLVVPDETLAELRQNAASDAVRSFAVWTGHAASGKALVKVLDELAPVSTTPVNLSGTGLAYREAISAVGLILFIGVFVSLVFFAACCSLLYFRLFTEIDEDRRHFKRLQQLGADLRELKRLALAQSMVVFLVPFLAGLVHSTFAMQALGTMASRTVLQFGGLVACGYLVLYAGYYAVTYNVYWRSIKAGLNRVA
ncbi:MAG: transporter permease protein [Symbiobacteriaceae bacterium]|jgi:putative ABC transport system permease protein|nr:transporter permease protein [Symbiobacteriaceae bacterium]